MTTCLSCYKPLNKRDYNGFEALFTFNSEFALNTFFFFFFYCSKTFSLAIASRSFDFESYESHTDTLADTETRIAFPFEAVVRRHHLFAVGV